jgi:hypothetical protein
MLKNKEVLEVLLSIDRKLANILAVVKSAKVKETQIQGDK